MDFVPTSTIQAFLASGDVMVCHRGGQFCQYQGRYGSCRMFSATEAWNLSGCLLRVEPAWDLPALQIASCMPFTGTYGCCG